MKWIVLALHHYQTSDLSFINNAILGNTANDVQGTGPKQTCCCSDKGDFPYKTDRIISNFGSGGDTTIVELTDIFGSIAKYPPTDKLQLGSYAFGEMHKPVFWKLKI